MAQAQDSATQLCQQNPAFSVGMMRAVIISELKAGQDLGTENPETLAQESAAKGVSDCAADMRADPGLAAVLAALPPADAKTGWDAYNVACADHSGSKGACITAEVDSAKAIKRMIALDRPAGLRTLVETCALVLPQTPAMAEWRACVDIAMATHPSDDDLQACKTSVPWHAAKTGAEAGRIVSACLGHAK
jgi:hypothetical protein